MLKRLTATVLAVTMLFSMSWTAFAEETTETKATAGLGVEESIKKNKDLLEAEFNELKYDHEAALCKQFEEYLICADGAFEYYFERYGSELRDILSEVKEEIKTGFVYETDDETHVEIQENKAGESVGAAAEEKVSANISFSVNGDTLTLSGTGGTGSFLYEQPAWYPYKDTIKKLVVNEGITTIGSDAFKNFSKLTTVVLPSTMLKISHRAFWGCVSLMNISIPDSVVFIGQNAFLNCSSLQSIELPDGAEMKDSVFSGCSSLTYVKLPSRLTRLENSTFWACKALTNVQLPSTITEIGSNAFTLCTSLSSIQLPAGLVEIGKSAFSYCQSLTSVTLPDSLKRLYSYAFDSCDSLRTVNVGSQLAVMGLNPFKSCSSLVNLNASANNYFNFVDSVIYSKDMKTLICYPEGRMVDTYTIQQGVTTIGEGSFTSFKGYNEPLIKTLIIPDSVTSIEDQAFFGTRIKNISMGKNVKEIGAEAFLWCDFPSIDLPSTLTRIGDEAFKFNYYLSSITIPKSVVSIGKQCFYRNQRLQAVNVASDNPCYSSKDGVLLTKDKKTIVQYPSGKKDTSYIMPDSVEELEEYAFVYNSDLENITFSDNLRIIKDSNLQDFDYIKSITLPDNLTVIEPYCLRLSRLENVTVGKRLVRISNAFQNCYSLSQICFYGNAPEDCEDMLDSCEETVEVIYPQNDRTWNGIQARVKNQALKYTARDFSQPFHFHTDINKASVSLSKKTYSYNGTYQEPKVTVKLGDETLRADVDYSVIYRYNKNVGKAQVEIRGINDFYGSQYTEFNIIKADQNLSVSIDKSNIRIGSYANIKENGVGAPTITSNNPYVVKAYGTTLFGAGVGTATITVTSPGNDCYNSATKKIDVTVSGTGINYSVKNLSYSFQNSARDLGYGNNFRIPKERYYMFYTPTQAAVEYANDDPVWGGSCGGFASSSVIFTSPYTSLSVRDFNSSASLVSDLKTGDRNSKLGINVREWIETMQVSQLAGRVGTFVETHHNCYNDLVDEVKRCQNGGLPVYISVWRSKTFGHALVGYRFEYVNASQDRIYLYDCNYPKAERYLTLKKSNGKYTGFYYEGGGYSYSYIIKYAPAYLYEELWNQRRTGTNKSNSVGAGESASNYVESLDETTMYINSDNCDISDCSGNIVAEIRAGELNSTQKNIYEISIPDNDSDSHILHLPTAGYSVKSLDDAYEENLEITVVNANQSATVKTQSDTVEILVDDTQNTNIVSVKGKEGESYDVTLNGDNEYTTDNSSVVFSGKSDGKGVRVGTVYGEYINDGSINSGICVDDVDINVENYNARDISGCDWNIESSSYGFTGEGIKPEITVTDKEGFALSQNEDYKVVYQENVNSGTAKGTIYGINDYKGYIDFDFTIQNVSLNDCDVALAYESCEYTGEKIEPKVTVSYRGTELNENQQYEIEYENNTEPGIAKVVVRGINGINGAVTKTFEIVNTQSFILGDANGDGRVSIRDVTAIQRHLADIEFLSGNAFTAADVDKNGSVTVSDATSIQMYLAEFITELG